MNILSVKSGKVGGDPCAAAVVAEAMVDTGDCGIVYVVIQEDGEFAMTVSLESVYEYLTGDGEPPEDGFDIASYGTVREANKTAYSPVVKVLRRAVRMLGECDKQAAPALRVVK